MSRDHGGLPSRSSLRGCCSRARRTEQAVEVAAGYLVRAERLEAYVPTSGRLTGASTWIYVLITPEGERLGGHDTIDTFVSFAFRHLQEREGARA